MSDNLNTAQIALTKLHNDKEAINKLALCETSLRLANEAELETSVCIALLQQVEPGCFMSAGN